MRFFDTHCHLDPDRYPNEVDAVLDRAVAAGVERMVAIGTGATLDEVGQAVALAGRRPEVWATAGFHPHDAARVTEPMLVELEAVVRHPRIVAIGEAGLDYHYDYSPREVQPAIFAAQIELARSVQKPIVIHNRESDDDCARLLVEQRAHEVGGVVHCFTSSWELARAALDAGFYLGFTGIVSFKNAEGVRDVLRRTPLDRIVIETDSPYLSPLPHRGRKNEPARVADVCTWVARTLGLDPGVVAEATWDNAHRLYRMPLA